jgi:outer membrane autotransporter protein
VTSRNTGGTSDANRFHVVGYGSYTGELVYADLQLGGAFGEDDIRRNQGVFGTTGRAKPGVNGVSAGGEIGVRLHAANWLLMPGIGFRVDQQSRDAVTETGAGALNQVVRSDTVTGSRFTFGIRAETTYPIAEGVRMTPSVRIHYAHDAGDVSATTVSTFAGLPGLPMRVNSTSIGRDAALIGLGTTLTLPNNIALYVRYDADLRERYTGHNLSGGLRYSW